MPRRLKFNPQVEVLTDSQINSIIAEADARAKDDPPPAPSRRSFFRRSATGAAVAVPSLLLSASVASAGPPTSKGRLPELYRGQNMRIFQEILDDESAHVEILQTLLIDQADTLPVRPVPKFRNLLQPSVIAFVRSAAAFENTGTGTYSGALFAIQQTPEYFPVAAGLATVEARHAGYINALLNEPLVPDFFPVDSPIPPSVALSHVDHFIADLNGGTTPSFDPNTPSDPNNFRIEDFLLLLEMVETAFYQVNVAKYFS